MPAAVVDGHAREGEEEVGKDGQRGETHAVVLRHDEIADGQFAHVVRARRHHGREDGRGRWACVHELHIRKVNGNAPAEQVPCNEAVPDRYGDSHYGVGVMDAENTALRPLSTS